jgi:hypothetical protein
MRRRCCRRRRREISVEYPTDMIFKLLLSGIILPHDRMPNLQRWRGAGTNRQSKRVPRGNPLPGGEDKGEGER